MNYTDEAFADGSARRRPVQPKRRFCKVTGCTRIVKSQGLCQRHGAKPRQCRIAGCTKQAQGSFEKMCKCHFNQVHTAYIAGQYGPAKAQVGSQAHVVVVAHEPSCVSAYGGACPINSGRQQQNNIPGAHTVSLVQYLKAGFDAGLPASWHRNEERQGRSLSHGRTPANLEDWERELVWIEILQLSDCSEDDCFTHLARAWGVDDLAQLLVSDPRTTTEERCVLATCSSIEQCRSPQTILSMPAADNHQVSGDFDKRFPGQYPFFLDLERQVDA